LNIICTNRSKIYFYERFYSDYYIKILDYLYRLIYIILMNEKTLAKFELIPLDGRTILIVIN